jgi:hypothetical protein
MYPQIVCASRLRCDSLLWALRLLINLALQQPPAAVPSAHLLQPPVSCPQLTCLSPGPLPVWCCLQTYSQAERSALAPCQQPSEIIHLPGLPQRSGPTSICHIKRYLYLTYLPEATPGIHLSGPKSISPLVFQSHSKVANTFEK